MARRKSTSILDKKDFTGEAPIGEGWSTCKKCGVEFEQFFIADRNIYASAAYCPSCRKEMKSRYSEDGSGALDVVLKFTPHSKLQEEVFLDEHRFNVVSAGARWGKDRTFIFKAIQYHIMCYNENRPDDIIPHTYGWLIAPTEKMAKQLWNELKAFMPKAMVENIFNSEMIMHTIGGGIIEVRSAYDPESLVAVGLDWVVITEAARISNMNIVWSNIEMRLNSPHRGLNGQGGRAFINSSPRGKNEFYKIWLWGHESSETYSPYWKSWKCSTWDNPEMASKGNQLIKSRNGKMVAYKDDLKMRMTPTRYAQDIEAEFLGGINSCFPTFAENCIARIPCELDDDERKAFIDKWREPKPFGKYVMGYDPAQNDMSPLIVIEEETGNIVRLVNMQHRGWTDQYETIAFYSRLYNNAVCKFSKTGHETIETELVNLGVPTSTVNEQGNNKGNMVINLQMIIQQGDLHVLADGSNEYFDYCAQMNDYGESIKNGRYIYSNQGEPHDDYVSASYVAFYPDSMTGEVLPFTGLFAKVNNNSGNRRYSALA